MHLADVNFWLALAFEAHTHHSRAVRWFDDLSPESCVMCRLTQNGLLRLATNQSVFGDEAVTMSQAWTLYDTLMADERISYFPEPHGLESFWREFAGGQSQSPKLWTDAYLAAFASASGMQVVTFYEGFRQFDGLKLTIPM